MPYLTATQTLHMDYLSNTLLPTGFLGKHLWHLILKKVQSELLLQVT